MLHKETLIYQNSMGGLNCPFMAIYIPADKSEKEALIFNSLIDMVENVTNSNEKFDKHYHQMM